MVRLQHSVVATGSGLTAWPWSVASAAREAQALRVKRFAPSALPSIKASERASDSPPTRIAKAANTHDSLLCAVGLLSRPPAAALVRPLTETGKIAALPRTHCSSLTHLTGILNRAKKGVISKPFPLSIIIDVSKLARVHEKLSMGVQGTVHLGGIR